MPSKPRRTRTPRWGAANPGELGLAACRRDNRAHWAPTPSSGCHNSSRHQGDDRREQQTTLGWPRRATVTLVVLAAPRSARLTASVLLRSSGSGGRGPAVPAQRSPCSARRGPARRRARRRRLPPSPSGTQGRAVAAVGSLCGAATL